jgi:hypothetical protein
MEREENYMIQFPVPHKSRFLPIARSFSAPFTGIYDFGIAANTDAKLLDLQANTVFIISSYSIGGNIASEDYLSAINTLPQFVLKRRNDGQQIHTGTVPVVQFEQNKEAMIFFESKQGDDELRITFAGILNQTGDLVGVDPVIINLSFSIFAIEDNEYAKKFFDKDSGNAGRRL